MEVPIYQLIIANDATQLPHSSPSLITDMDIQGRLASLSNTDAPNGMREPELGLHLFGLFAVLLSSSFGTLPCIRSMKRKLTRVRRTVSDCRKESQKATNSNMGLLLCKTFWHRCHHRHCIHSRTFFGLLTAPNVLSSFPVHLQN